MKRFTFVIIIFILASCNSTRQAAYENIKSGQDLDKVNLISFDSFFNQWVFNRKVQKIDLNIREIYKDNQFIYFAKPIQVIPKEKWTFFKVYSDTLTERFPNYKDFYGSELREYLWTKVVPKEDFDLYRNNRTARDGKMFPNCPNRKNKPNSKYSLLDHRVILTVTWEVDCEDLEHLKNKIFKASYNLLTGQYSGEQIDSK